MPDTEVKLDVLARHPAPFPNESQYGSGGVGGASPANTNGRKPDGAQAMHNATSRHELRQRMSHCDMDAGILVRHPAPFNTETPDAYVLRFAELNEYATSWSVPHSHAGMEHHETKPNFPRRERYA